jgi:adenine-specific DNA-methyltransferase
MMYPRLFLARQLLREDGVIFVSIDDNEMYHLRLLMNEVFGPENFVTTVIWQKVYAPKNTAKYFSEDHDYIVVYARNKEIWRPNLLPRTEEANARYENLDDDPRGPWKASDMTARNPYSEGQYDVTSPSGRQFSAPRGRYWAVNHERFLELDRDNRVWWGPDGNNMPALKRFLSEVQQGIVPQTLWEYGDVGHTQEAKKDLLRFVDFEHTENVLNTLKPARLMQRMLQIGTDTDAADLVVDFFSGSAATAHAVLKQNREDGGNRRFVMVQLAEPLPKPEPHLDTIADIGKTRIRRVIEEMEAEEEGQLDLRADEDLGFKVFRFAPSTFRQWEAPEVAGAETLREQLALFDRGLEEGAKVRHVIYEVILKLGYSLNARFEPLELESNQVYEVTDELVPGTSTVPGTSQPSHFYICLDDKLQNATVDVLPLDKETTFVCLDTALDDSQKVNLAMQCLLKVF